MVDPAMPKFRPNPGLNYGLRSGVMPIIREKGAVKSKYYTDRRKSRPVRQSEVNRWFIQSRWSMMTETF
jgi:hypothetical protein